MKEIKRKPGRPKGTRVYTEDMFLSVLSKEYMKHTTEICRIMQLSGNTVQWNTAMTFLKKLEKAGKIRRIKAGNISFWLKN